MEEFERPQILDYSISIKVETLAAIKKLSMG